MKWKLYYSTSNEFDLIELGLSLAIILYGSIEVWRWLVCCNPSHNHWPLDSFMADILIWYWNWMRSVCCAESNNWYQTYRSTDFFNPLQTACGENVSVGWSFTGWPVVLKSKACKVPLWWIHALVCNGYLLVRENITPPGNRV